MSASFAWNLHWPVTDTVRLIIQTALALNVIYMQPALDYAYYTAMVALNTVNGQIYFFIG